VSNLSDLLPAGASAKSITATDSGSGIAINTPVILETAGTVTQVSGVTGSSGTPVVFESAEVSFVSATFDSNSNKVVIAYHDSGNSYYGTAVVGTVSGDAISYGTPVVFESAAVNYVANTFDSNENKVVIAYRDDPNSDYGTAIVGTVSGTAISFGSAAVFESARSDYISITFDSNENKVVIAYQDSGNSSYGTAVVGTVSGTAISFGTAVVFEAATTLHISCAFDSDANKVVISYQDQGNSSYGTGIVGTVSGTAISFGTAVVYAAATTTYTSCAFDSDSNKVVIAYNIPSQGTAVVGTVSGTSISYGTPVVYNAATTAYISATFNSSANRVVIAYRDEGNSNYGTSIIGTVSGTAISFGTEVVFETASVFYVSATFDSNSNKVVIAYRDSGNSGYGTGIVTTTGYTNLTTSNFLGIADEAISASASGVIVVQGGTKTGLSGFTIGSNIYVTPAGNFTSDGATYYGTGYDLAAASYASKSFSVASQESAPTSFAFKTDDGTKMYMLGNSGGNVYQYTLSTGFDISTASYDSVSFSISSQDTTAEAIIFNTDGTKMYMCGQQNKTVYQYSLSSGWDLSTASYDTVSLSVTSQDTSPKALAFNADGTKMFMCGSDTDAVYQYSLSSGFDLSTASYDSVTFSISSQESAPTSLAFSADGTKMFTAGYGNDTVYQYTLSGGFDLSTASYASISFSIASEETTPMEIHFNTDTPLGIKMFSIGSQAGAVYQYATSTVGTATVKAGLAISTTSLLLSGDS